MGMRFISLLNNITSLSDILNHLQSDSLYRKLHRIEVQLSTRVCLVLRVETWFTVFPEETFECVAVLGEHLGLQGSGP